jgi:hypothetical protein
MRLIDETAYQYKIAKIPMEERTFVRAWETAQNMPTIDAVPVVRCGECRYRQKAKVNRKGFLICPASGMEITDDDFCSYGERKEPPKGDHA